MVGQVMSAIEHARVELVAVQLKEKLLKNVSSSFSVLPKDID